MIIGESGSGRSTFINTLCDEGIVESSGSRNGYAMEELSLRKSNVELEDNEGVKINLNIIDTPGFGNSIDNEKSFKVIKDYIKYQFDEILIEESRLRRNPRFKDGRIHCCLYFITSTGHGLREIDVELMKELGDYVNIIPCLSKCDSLTVDEVKLNKRLINEDIEHYRLPIFDFNNEYFTYDDGLDDETMELNRYLQKSIPFAVMGSNNTVRDAVSGETKRVRKYAWGTIDVFDNAVSDVSTLKTTLLATHLGELKDFTHEVLYENYRTRMLGEAGDGAGNAGGAGGAGGDLEGESGGDAHGQSLDESAAAAEEARVRALEMRVQQEVAEKRAQIEQRARELAELERRLAHSHV